MKNKVLFRLLLPAAVAGALGIASLGATQNRSMMQEQAWTKLKTLAGNWNGTGQGKPGTSKIDRSYEVILQGHFILARNDSQFASTTAGQPGERHEDLGVYSFDKARDKVVLREFHSEGFVNQYVLESVSEDGDRLTFVSEAVENGPSGLRARLTIHMVDRKTIRELFELAWPGKDFEPCVQALLSR